VTVGIIGGLGPAAGAAFYLELVRATAAMADEDHPGVVLRSPAGLPDRRQHLLGHGRSPLPALQAVARDLERDGVDVIALPSATTHAYWSEIQESTTVPLINLLAETAKVIDSNGYTRPALLATGPSICLGLFDRHLQPGCPPLTPDAATQHVVGTVVDGVKANRDLDQLAGTLQEAVSRSWAEGADALLLGCTELHLLADRLTVPLPVIDCSSVLAAAVLRELGMDQLAGEEVAS
jgi:aspartate racemase